VISLGLALWGATGVMSSVQKTLAVVFDGGVARGLVRGRLVSGLLVLGALGLILCALVVSVLENVARKVSDNVDEALGWQPFGFGIVFGVVVPVALTFAVFVLLFRSIPRHRPGWRAVLIGAAAAALGFQAVQVGLGWYLSGPADFTKLYGSASAVFAFLFSVYLSATALVIGAVFTAVLDERLGPARS
jgi:membrane protein